MSTTAQIEANQANAQLSTGPRTPEGKTASSANAIKLGLYAKQAVLLTPQDHTEFEALESAYAFELRPYTPVEQTLFSQVVLAAWNIQRANRLEADLADSLGADPLLAESKTLDRIAAARHRAERTFHKSLKELRASQTACPPPQAKLQNKPNYITNGNGTHLRSQLKTGRNEACPCNSGRKFKHCCLENGNEPNAPYAPPTTGATPEQQAA